MRRIQKRSWTDREAVSPVIATILLVAITVVLVGMLYMWVNSLIQTPKTATPSVGASVIDGDEFYTVYIDSVTGSGAGGIPISSVRWGIQDAGGSIRESGRTDSKLVYGNITLYPPSTTNNVGFADEPADAKLNQRDYYVIRKYDYKTDMGVGASGGALILSYYTEDVSGATIARIPFP